MPENMSFEQALLRLEEIAGLLESEDITLDESVKLYEEGVKLAQLCDGKIKSARQKVTELTAEGEAESDD